MNIALLPILLTPDVALKAVRLIDTVSGVLLRLSGLGLLAWGTSSAATIGPNQDLIELQRMDIVELFRQIACLLLDADRMCPHIGRKAPADRTDLLRRLIGSSQDLYKQVPLATYREGVAISDAPIVCNETETTTVTCTTSTGSAASSHSSSNCLCQSHSFQEALYQLSLVAEEAYSHIVAIEYRRQQHRASWKQYLPGYALPDHSVNLQVLRTSVVPRMERRIQRTLQSAQWADTVLTHRSTANADISAQLP